jgi:hypothetical protein
MVTTKAETYCNRTRKTILKPLDMTNQIQFYAKRAGKLHAIYTTLNPGVPFQKWKETDLQTLSRAAETAMKGHTDRIHACSDSPFSPSWVEEMFKGQV